MPIRNATSNLPGWRVFLSVGDDAGLGQLHHAVGEHLGVDAQVLLVLEEEGTASGMAPMPNWRVAPSGTREAQCSPMAFSMSPILGA